ncbi:MAG TPA: methyl-accepting chemotaxis protein [Marinobacter sp.]|nr:methyl-accepting chemotaxis protein [Marinobacter sp.]
MNFLTRLGFRTKIALPFIITTIALLFIGVFGVSTTRNLVGDTDRIARTYLPSVSEILNADRDLYQALVAQMAYVTAMINNEDGSKFLDSFNENVGQALDRFQQAEEKLRDTDVIRVSGGFRQAYDQWLKSAREVIALASAGNTEEAHTLARTEASTRFSTLRSYYNDVGAHADERAYLHAAAATLEGQRAYYITLTTMLASVVISTVLFVIFLRVIITSVTTLKTQLDNIANGDGDLTQRIPIEAEDDLGRLAGSFNLVLQNLQDMITSIQKLSRELHREATDLASAAKDNNDGISRQTDSITMVATAINQMQSAIEEVAGNANQAAVITQQAETSGQASAGIIHKSSEQVHKLALQISKAVEVIRKLASDSESITSVLDVIRGVAEQTNLLALNAAIEAARAGDHGRGFAVVADEVRTLALRTQRSTEDIQTMIGTLQNGVANIVSVMETGSSEASETEKLAGEAEVELNMILQAMARISDVNTSVASAAEQQTQVVDEINRNITEINDLAEDSVERSKGIDSISKTLEGYASNLQLQTGRFRV